MASDPRTSTIAAHFQHQVQIDGGRPAIHLKRYGQYQALSWNEIAKDVFEAAGALRKLGVSRGDRVLQLSENRYEWIVIELAIQFCRAVHVPVHAPLTAKQVAYQLQHSGASLAIASNAEQAAKLAAIDAPWHDAVRLFTYEKVDTPVGREVPPTLREIIETLAEQDRPQLVNEDWSDVAADDVTTIIYTSGTTGEPKGVVLTHANLLSNACSATEMFGEHQDDLRLTFLPLSHIFARTCDLYTWIITGYELALAENRETIVLNANEICPTLINGVPYFFERLKKYLDAHELADTAGSLRGLLGGSIRACCSGGAALPDEVFDLFMAQDVPLLQGYGLTESSPVVSLSSMDAVRRGTVGRPLPDVDVQVAADGEILVRGPNVMPGYWHDPQATEEVIRDGWLHTGDLGFLDDDGFLTINGRKKELIVTATGKNIAPVLIESLLCRDPLVEQAMVIGDDRKFLMALIVPNLERLTDALESQDQFDDTSQTIDLAHPTFIAIVRQRITDQLRDLAHYEQIGQFLLIDKPFTIEAGQLTPKLTLRRAVIEEDYRDEIEDVYESAES